MRRTQAGVLFALLAACVFLQASPTVAQTVGTATGAIDGTARDDTGAVVTGVTITISSPALMGTPTRTTNAAGFYRFPALPPGEYTLAFALKGFKDERRDRVRVGVGFTATVDVVLHLAALKESVVVERQSYVVDRQSTAIVTRFDASQLANLPGSRSMFSILSATPAVSVNRFDVGGNAATIGVTTGAFGTAGNNRPMLEGIDLTNIQGTGFTFDYGSFDEVSVYTAGHSVEWPKPGVQMQFIAKSGGNQYRWTFYADYENRRWQSFNIDDDQIARDVQGGGGLSPRDVNRLWSYHDVNADVGGYIKKDALWWYFSFRDQDVAARQITFPVGPHRTRVTNYSGKGTYQVTPNNRIVAYGQAGRNHQPNLLSPSGLVTGLNSTTAINESVESTTEQLAWGRVWKVDWNSVLSDRVFLEIRAGQFGGDRHETPNGSLPRVEDLDTLRVAGGHRDFMSKLRRDQLFGSASYFKDGWFGNHHFKGGGEIYRTTQADAWRTGFPGDVLHVVRNGDPQQVYLLEPSQSEAGFWTYAAYVSDAWRLNGRLTLNLGLRFDRFRLFLPEQEHPVGRFNPTAQPFSAANLIDWNVLSPRIGVTHDVAGDGRTILKFSYGQYQPSPGVDTGFNANPNAPVWWKRYAWSDLNGSKFWEPGEERGTPSTRGGLESLDPELDLPFAREVAGWVERELPANVGVRTGIVWRGGRQHFTRQNSYEPFEAFVMPVEISDYGPDGEVGGGDDGPPIPGRELELVRPSDNILRNVPNSDTHYWTWDIVANKRFSGRWSLVAGFAHTWSRDHASGYTGQTVRQNAFPLTPNDLINAGPDGRYKFRVWTAKVHGTYQAPWDVRITPLLRHQSGQPFGRTFTTLLNGRNVRILAEPIGTRRMDNITILDARVEKGFALPHGRRVAVFVDVFNIFNANPEQNLNWLSGQYLLQPLNIVAPRIARVGAKLHW